MAAAATIIAAVIIKRLIFPHSFGCGGFFVLELRKKVTKCCGFLGKIFIIYYIKERCTYAHRNDVKMRSDPLLIVL